MTVRDFGTPELDALAAECQDIPLVKGTRALIVSSPAPSAVLASALLSRSIMKTRGIFHVTFVEPVLNATALALFMDANPSHTIMVIGVDLIDDLPLDSMPSSPLLIGSTINREARSYYSFCRRDLVSVGAYVIAREKLETGPEELYLGAAGLLVQNQSAVQPDSVAKEMITLAQDGNVLRERRGFRIFGADFLPLTETLSNSISPYLRGISGSVGSCERILGEADIPSTRHNMPITSLTSEEKRRLTEKLVVKLDGSVIHRLLGLDFENCLELEGSPLHLLSAIQSMSDIAWSRHEVGSTMAVWVGDHARMLRVLLDSCRLHCRDTISGVQQLLSVQSKHEVVVQSDRVAVASLSGVQSSVLPDVGRISFENAYVDKEHFLVLERDDCACIVWAFDDLELSDVLQSLNLAELSSSSASPKSVLVQLDKEKRESLLSTLHNLAGEIR